MTLIYPTYSRFIVATVFILLMAGGLSAQNPPSPKEKVEAMRVAFITNRLELSPAEAKQFWPVYNSYRHDLSQLRRSFYPSDEGANSHLDAERQMEFEQKKLDLKKQYLPQFEQVIGKVKLNKLVSAEEDFKRLLIQTMRNRRQQRPGGRWQEKGRGAGDEGVHGPRSTPASVSYNQASIHKSATNPIFAAVK